MRIIAIGGQPATGKTALMKKIRIKGKPFKMGTLRGEFVSAQDLYFLGVFDGSPFEGTDRLSMAVQPDALRFFKYCERVQPNCTVVFEGDRLFNAGLFNAIKNQQVRIFVLEAATGVVAERHKARNDTQPETFIKGRITKVENIKREFAANVTLLRNENAEDLERNAALIKGLFNGGQ